MARVTRKSEISGITRTLSLPYYSQDEFLLRYNKWKSGEMHIEDAFPEVSVEGREFIMRGVTGEELREFQTPGDPGVFFRTPAADSWR